MIYVHLFHGRTDPNEELNDWGIDGPVLGPFLYYHTTYRHHTRFGLENGDIWELFFDKEDGDLVYYNGIYYGDFSIAGKDTFIVDDLHFEEFNIKKTTK